MIDLNGYFLTFELQLFNIFLVYRRSYRYK